MTQAVRIFDTVDLDKDEELDKEEIRKLAEHELGLAFSILDADDDGVLRSPEEALTKLKTSIFDQVLDEVFPLYAGDDDKLDPKDFSRFWKIIFPRDSDLFKVGSCFLTKLSPLSMSTLEKI